MVLTTTEAAKELGISSRRVLELIQGGRLPAKPFGNTYMINAKDLALVRNRKPGRPRKTTGKKESGGKR